MKKIVCLLVIALFLMTANFALAMEKCVYHYDGSHYENNWDWIHESTAISISLNDDYEYTDEYLEANYTQEFLRVARGTVTRPIWSMRVRFNFADNPDEITRDIYNWGCVVYVNNMVNGRSTIPDKYGEYLDDTWKTVLVNSIEEIKKDERRKIAEERREVTKMQDELSLPHQEILEKYPMKNNIEKKVALIYGGTDEILSNEIIDKDIQKLITEKFPKGKCSVQKDAQLRKNILDYYVKYNMKNCFNEMDDSLEKEPFINAGIKAGYDYVIVLTVAFGDWQVGWNECRQNVKYNVRCFDMRNGTVISSGIKKCVAIAPVGNWSGYRPAEIRGIATWMKPKRNILHEQIEIFLNELNGKI